MSDILSPKVFMLIHIMFIYFKLSANKYFIWVLRIVQVLRVADDHNWLSLKQVCQFRKAFFLLA